VDVIKGEPPPAPQAFNANEVHLTEIGLSALIGLWAAGKAGQGLSGIAKAAGAGAGS
jgi:hypothetical protein